MIPLTVGIFDESDGAKYQLQGDGRGSHDTPRSNSPNAVRTSVYWAPGTIVQGGMTYLDSARIIAPLVARVMIENRYNASPVNVPGGTMNLLAESAVSTAGNNEDAWTFVSSGAVRLLANEKRMIAVRSKSPGDYLQIDNVSFLRIANVVP